jgi:hypothetical protein
MLSSQRRCCIIYNAIAGTRTGFSCPCLVCVMRGSHTDSNTVGSNLRPPPDQKLPHPNGTNAVCSRSPEMTKSRSSAKPESHYSKHSLRCNAKVSVLCEFLAPKWLHVLSDVNLCEVRLYGWLVGLIVLFDTQPKMWGFDSRLNWVFINCKLFIASRVIHHDNETGQLLSLWPATCLSEMKPRSRDALSGLSLGDRPAWINGGMVTSRGKPKERGGGE